MPSYMTIVVLALAASNASVALSAPVPFPREVQEQSLSRRDTPGTSAGHLPSTPEEPPLEGEKETDPLLKQPPGAVAKGGGWKSQLTNFSVGVVATLVGVSALKVIWGSRPSSSSSAPASSSTTSTAQNYPSASSYSPTQSGQSASVYQSQRRAAGNGKGLDFSEIKARSILDKNRRATSHLELLSRADLGEALKVFSRVLDELD
ncbi:hypothetical protein BGY98DRAFT_87058 [Russula aff. rugulosa BPL654]|nr:hypothetical protein BGY98DRAFT_87058 [Russula aff. rugulosa BPL654]